MITCTTLSKRNHRKRIAVFLLSFLLTIASASADSHGPHGGVLSKKDASTIEIVNAGTSQVTFYNLDQNFSEKALDTIEMTARIDKKPLSCKKAHAFLACTLPKGANGALTLVVKEGGKQFEHNVKLPIAKTGTSH